MKEKEADEGISHYQGQGRVAQENVPVKPTLVSQLTLRAGEYIAQMTGKMEILTRKGRLREHARLCHKFSVGQPQNLARSNQLKTLKNLIEGKVKEKAFTHTCLHTPNIVCCF